jgi:hypothetical protein
MRVLLFAAYGIYTGVGRCILYVASFTLHGKGGNTRDRVGKGDRFFCVWSDCWQQQMRVKVRCGRPVIGHVLVHTRRESTELWSFVHNSLS